MVHFMVAYDVHTMNASRGLVDVMVHFMVAYDVHKMNTSKRVGYRHGAHFASNNQKACLACDTAFVCNDFT